MKKFCILAAAGMIAFAPLSLGAQEAQQAKASAEETRESSDSEGEPRKEENEQAEAKEKKICKRIRSMGSRFSEKVCLSKAQWQAERNGTQDEIRDNR